MACTWRNDTSWDSVAAYSFTGTLTSPKDTAPFQIARMGRTFRNSRDGSRSTAQVALPSHQYQGRARSAHLGEAPERQIRHVPLGAREGT